MFKINFVNTLELYSKYAQESYQNSFDHGFWEEGESRSKGKMVMLIISELSEAMEADRDNHELDYHSVEEMIEYGADDVAKMNFATMNSDDLWKFWFELCVKNCRGDEMADVAIRIMDFVYGWRCVFLEREYRKESTGDFAHDLLRLNWYIMLAFEQKDDLHPGKDWGYAWAALIKFCEWWNIDLDFHISCKQRYNRTPPVKHGRLY